MRFYTGEGEGKGRRKEEGGGEGKGEGRGRGKEGMEKEGMRKEGIGRGEEEEKRGRERLILSKEFAFWSEHVRVFLPAKIKIIPVLVIAQ